MAHADNVQDANVTHIEWSNDALVFYFAKAKGDQEGDKATKPWHVYSNPLQPHLCPVLAFATYIFTHPGVLANNGKNNLFPGNDQYGQFKKVFCRVIDDNEKEFLALGVARSDLGSHSARKGKLKK